MLSAAGPDAATGTGFAKSFTGEMPLW